MKKNLLDWLSYMQSIHVSAIDMGLSRVLPVAEYLDLLNLAEKKYVFTVAGTNGKGSTTAVIAEVCQKAGYKTGLYQSPHLLKFNERVKINGVGVSDNLLIDAFEQVEQARLVCGLSLSFFEMTTLAAFLIFAQANCDVWVLEVGLGGRLDVVNIINPNVTVITNIGIDHTDWLGNDRERIGYEKAGIMRPNVPLVYGETDMPMSVQAQVDELGIRCYQLGQDFAFLSDGSYSRESNINQQTWQYTNFSTTHSFSLPKLSLINASNAVTALLVSELMIKPEHIEQGLQNVQLAGRFDIRNIEGKTWVFDVAHNQAGVEFLLSQLTPLLPCMLENDNKNFATPGQIKIIFSMLKDKEISNVVSHLYSKLAQINTSKNTTISWYVAPIDSTYNPRSANIHQLTTAIEEYVDTKMIYTFTSLEQATDTVMQEAQSNDVVLVCGSFHTIAECLVAIETIKAA